MGDPSDRLSAVARRFVDEPPWLPLVGVVRRGARPLERVAFEPGLAEEELQAVERRFRFTFPPDLRDLLAVALPVSRGFPDWRAGDEEALDAALERPADGICFDVTHNAFWLREWGPRPLDTDAACDLAREEIASAPVLIPIYGHRYLPATPAASGNPVFSVVQSDIIFYAEDLADYLEREFVSPASHPPVSTVRQIVFWSDLAQ